MVEDAGLLAQQCSGFITMTAENFHVTFYGYSSWYS